MFLSIVTRHMPGREASFERLVKSLLAQTSQDYQHVVIRNGKNGLLDANQSFARHKDEVTGDYVFIVDDDDYIVYPRFIEELRAQVELNPDVVFVRLQFDGCHGDMILPPQECWDYMKLGGPPVVGWIGCPCYVVRRDIWKEHIHAFGQPACGDYAFIATIREQPRLTYAFWDEVIVVVDHIGKPERGE